MFTIVLAAGIGVHFQFAISLAQTKARRMKASPLNRMRFSLLSHPCLLLLFYGISKFPRLSMFTCSCKPLYFGGALLSPYEPIEGTNFFANFVCMLLVKEGYFVCFQMFNTSPCFCFNLCYTLDSLRQLGKKCSQLH